MAFKGSVVILLSGALHRYAKLMISIAKKGDVMDYVAELIIQRFKVSKDEWEAVRKMGDEFDFEGYIDEGIAKILEPIQREAAKMVGE